jgi:hypothetical protein
MLVCMVTWSISYGHFMVTWSILRPFYGHLVYRTAILWSFGNFFSIFKCCTQENLATLQRRTDRLLKIYPDWDFWYVHR